ncbi:hypothetical protein BEL04_08155 [Mucilaginibacter sp. PPCGB 2223]|uniref:site-specific integrase n=1 Tax=Mucilaginibacter sp. PPCGB 2223 TaxID=1886027 RepID=UPI000826ED39|nr:site-specific integrase [Mucilaginibacter sp. PPCGB 2223]OCX54222.1 hypothetical protein BEL04_08155 [Mucilaginibacter sp. PPCGB 2223]
MKINEELSILFWLKRDKGSKDGLVPIYVRITVNGDRDGFSSGKKIHPDHWDEEKGEATADCPNHLLINSYITKTLAGIERSYNQVSASSPRIKAVMVKDAYLPKKTSSHTLMQAFGLHNDEFAVKVKKKKGSQKTLDRFERLKDYTRAFLKKKYKVADIDLEDINTGFAVNFYHHLLAEDIGENTAMKYVKTLKQIVKRAKIEGWTKFNALEGFKCTYEQPDREYLEMDEVMRIYRKKIDIERLAEVRDAFIFCCFTGYAYETTYNLAPENVFKGLDGKQWVTKDRSKTGSEECVPLMPIPLAIIKKYQDHPYCVEYNKLLPINSNYRYNVYLKELANICGIKKNLTTHTARHTFATTVTLENDVPIETVGRMLGHKDLRTTQIYAKVTKRKISNNMKALTGKIFTTNGNLKSA